MCANSTLVNKEQVDKFHDALCRLLKNTSSLVSAEELCDRLDYGDATERDMRYFRRRYHGNMNDLDHAIGQYLRDCIQGIQILDEACRENGLLDTVESSDPMLVLRLLRSGERRSKYRRLSQYHRNRGEILTLRQIEREFRRLPKPVEVPT